MKLAILHYSVPPIIGGVEVTIAAHARLLRAHGHTVKLVAGRGEDAILIPEIDSRHPRVEAIQRELNRGNVTPDFFALVQELAQTLENVLRDVDVVVAHNVVTLHKNLALTSALHQIVTARKYPLVAWCHDFAWDDPVYAEDMHRGEPWELMLRVWENTKYVVVSEARRRDLARLLQLDEAQFALQISVVPPGIDAAEFFQVSETSAGWLRELHLLDAAPLLLLPARVTRRKNIELAIDIVAALRDNQLAPKLVVMGPLGPHNPANVAYLEELKTRAREISRGDVVIAARNDNVGDLSFRAERDVMIAETSNPNAERFLATSARNDNADDVIFLQEHAAVSDLERRDLYALADALLFPSAREGFGIPILEAGLARLPIFCADIPPFRESAQEFAHYFALDESPQAIAARMAEFFKTDSRYQLKRRVVTNYAWDSIVRRYILPILDAL